MPLAQGSVTPMPLPFKWTPHISLIELAVSSPTCLSFPLITLRARHSWLRARLGYRPLMAPVTILQANLATICFSSALYGIFFVLTVTSLAVTVRRHNVESAGAIPTSAAVKPKFRFTGPWHSPLFIATLILLLVISAVR